MPFKMSRGYPTSSLELSSYFFGHKQGRYTIVLASMPPKPRRQRWATVDDELNSESLTTASCISVCNIKRKEKVTTSFAVCTCNLKNEAIPSDSNVFFFTLYYFQLIRCGACLATFTLTYDCCKTLIHLKRIRTWCGQVKVRNKASFLFLPSRLIFCYPSLSKII